MLIPYPLEPPPPLPPLDDTIDAPGADLDAGRRARRGADRVAFHEGPRLERLDVLGPPEVRDRRIVALEEPLFVWEVQTTGRISMTAEVRFPAARVRYERTEDGSRLWLGGDAPTDELLVACYGGAVEATDEGGALRLHAQGRDKVRLAIVGAWNEEDRDRTLRALMRKGVAGVVAQQLRHAEMISALGAKLTTPDRELNDRFELEKRELDAGLREWRTGHRALLDPYSDGVALLTLGLREAVRDTLRGPVGDRGVRRLFAAYGDWAGADDFVRRHWPRLAQAVRDAAQGDPAVGELIPLAEALGDHEAVGNFEEILRAGGTGPRPAREVPTPLDRWHITPGALDGTVALAPELPSAWPEMTLERLRIGETSLDVRMRRRPGGVAVKLRVTRGPPIVVQLAPRLPFVPTGVLWAGEQLPGPAVRATVDDEVEGVWYT